MALLAGAMCGVRNDSCSRKHKFARTSHGMASESLSRGVHMFFAQEFCFLKQEHGPPRGSKQAKTDVLLTTVLGPLRSEPVNRAGRRNRAPAGQCRNRAGWRCRHWPRKRRELVGPLRAPGRVRCRTVTLSKRTVEPPVPPMQHPLAWLVRCNPTSLSFRCARAAGSGCTMGGMCNWVGRARALRVRVARVPAVRNPL